MSSIAILITCFNRKEHTLKCLERLYSLGRTLDIFLVDDNSTDGTLDAVQQLFPQVKLKKGNGNLFWNRGMCLAWEEAAKSDYEYYLWLNDDVVLYDYCLTEIMECSGMAGDNAIISGIIESKDKSETLYGGSDQHKKLILPNGEIQRIAYLNGNVVLVPKAVYHILGTLDPTYHHDMGDVDYGFRAQVKNIPVYITRRPIGYGEYNPLCRERVNNTTLVKRFKKLYSPLGSNPNLNFYFRKKYESIFNAIGYYIFQHILNIIPDKLNYYIFGNKYQ
jgi:GT2 family glycosyltransferase